MDALLACFARLRVVDGLAIPGCTARIDRRFPGSWSVEYLHAGRMVWSCDGRSPEIIDRPALFWHLPGPRYAYGPVDRRGWDHHYLLLDGPRAADLVGALQALHPCGWLAVADPGLVRGTMLEALARREAGTGAEASALVELLVARATAPGERDPVRRAAAAWAARIRDRPLAPWSAAAEARAAGCSEVHLRRAFRAVTGRSPTALALAARMTLARRALAAGGAVADAGRAAGYTDPAQFSRMFRRVVGIAPVRWRMGALPDGDAAGD
ncbi:MAG: hypothetical protein RLZZ127_936 [Planctomycetota bacterium]|jgi:AraC-like DNA-binding protein